MTQERLSLGAWGEEQAVRFLESRKLRILARNFTTPIGEVDIIACNRKEVIFVEVKTRRSNAFGGPFAAVGARKQRQILRAAQWYLAQNKSRLQPRFDVIGVMPGARGEAQIDHLPAAFGLDGS